MICVLGNSHTKIIRNGWPDNLKTRYFCSSGVTLGSLKLEGTTLTTENKELAEQLSRTSGGMSMVELLNYDGFLIVGLQMTSRSLSQVYATHRLANDATGRHVVVSEPCLEETFYDTLNSSTAANLARFIRAVSKCPILIVPEPQPPEQFAVGRILWQHPAINQKMIFYFEKVLRRLGAELDIGFVEQPDSTYAPSFLTKASYCAFADDIASGKDVSATAMLHMNDAFGALLMPQILAALTKERRTGDTLPFQSETSVERLTGST